MQKTALRRKIINIVVKGLLICLLAAIFPVLPQTAKAADYTVRPIIILPKDWSEGPAVIQGYENVIGRSMDKVAEFYFAQLGGHSIDRASPEVKQTDQEGLRDSNAIFEYAENSLGLNQPNSVYLIFVAGLNGWGRSPLDQDQPSYVWLGWDYVNKGDTDALSKYMAYEISMFFGLNWACSEAYTLSCPAGVPVPSVADVSFNLMAYEYLLRPAMLSSYKLDNTKANPQVRTLYQSRFINPEGDQAPGPIEAQPAKISITEVSAEEIKPGMVLEIKGTGFTDKAKSVVYFYRTENGRHSFLGDLFEAYEADKWTDKLLKVKFKGKEDFDNFPEVKGQSWGLWVDNRSTKESAKWGKELKVAGKNVEPKRIDTEVSVKCGSGGNQKILSDQTIYLWEASDQEGIEQRAIGVSQNDPISLSYEIPQDYNIKNANYSVEILPLVINGEKIKAQPGDGKVELALLRDRNLTSIKNKVTFAYPQCPSQTVSASSKTPTTVAAHIYGKRGNGDGDNEVINLPEGTKTISVGARVFVNNDPYACVQDNVDLKLEKIKNADGSETNQLYQNMNITFDNVDQSGGDGNPRNTDPVYVNCISYQAYLGDPVDGTYKLTAAYNPDSDSSYLGNSDEVTLVVKEGQMELIPTKSDAEISQPQSNMFKNSNVAGLAVRRDGDQTIIVNDSSVSSQSFEVTPKVSEEGQSCDNSKFPYANLVVSKKLKNGDLIKIIDEPSSLNCQPRKITPEELGDIDEIESLEIRVRYTDEESRYASSEAMIVIPVIDANSGGPIIIGPGNDIGTIDSDNSQVNQVMISNYSDFRPDNDPGDLGSPTQIVDLSLYDERPEVEWTLSTLSSNQFKSVYVKTVEGRTDCDTYCGYMMGDGEATEAPFKDPLISIKAFAVNKLIRVTAVVNDESVEIDPEGGLQTRLDGQVGQAQDFEIPNEREESKNGVKPSVFQIAYRPVKSIIGWECDYGKEESKFFIKEMYSNDTWRVEKWCDDQNGGNLCRARNEAPEGYPVGTPDAECYGNDGSSDKTVKGFYCSGNQMMKRYTDDTSAFSCTCGDDAGDCTGGTDATICEKIPDAEAKAAGLDSDAKCVSPSPSPSPIDSSSDSITGWYCGGTNGNSIFESHSNGSVTYSCTCGDNNNENDDCKGGTAATVCQPAAAPYPYTEDAECVEPQEAPISPPAPTEKRLIGWYCSNNSIFERYSDGTSNKSCDCGSGAGDCQAEYYAPVCWDKPRERVPEGFESDAECVSD